MGSVATATDPPPTAGQGPRVEARGQGVAPRGPQAAPRDLEAEGRRGSEMNPATGAQRKARSPHTNHPHPTSPHIKVVPRATKVVPLATRAHHIKVVPLTISATAFL